MPAAEAVLTGMPDDGGLYVPVQRPLLPWPPPSGDPLPPWIARKLLPGLDGDLVSAASSYASSFGFPLVEVEPGRFVLELFHGPTHAFKDVGARFLAHVVSGLVAEADSMATVLVATSGDTGGAVARAFLGKAGTRVVVLFPVRGVSDRQRRQMTTLGRNVVACAVDGSFDDCQRIVKEAFALRQLRREVGLTSANSINVARLLPQAIYYADAVRALGRAPWFVVPSGNLGNLCAGLIAAEAGMPAAGFVAATNRNHGFIDYLAGQPFVPVASSPTVSNAMDVGAPSNLERIRWLLGSDAAVRARVRGGWVDDDATLATIRSVFERTGHLLDPHSAVAWAAAERHDPGSAPVVVLATAHPGKFPDVVERAVGVSPPVPEGLRLEAEEEFVQPLKPSLEDLVAVLKAAP